MQQVIATIRFENPSQFAIPAQSAASERGRYDMTKAEIWIDPIHVDDRGADAGLTSAEVAASITTTNGRILSTTRLPKATRVIVDDSEACLDDYGSWTREHLPIRALVPAKEFAKVVKGTKPLTVEIVQGDTLPERNGFTVRVRADGRYGGAVTEFGRQAGDEAEQTFPQCSAVIPKEEDTEEVITLDAEYLKKMLAACTRKGDRVDIRLGKKNPRTSPVTFQVRESKESKNPGFEDGRPIGVGIIMPISKD